MESQKVFRDRWPGMRAFYLDWLRRETGREIPEISVNRLIEADVIAGLQFCRAEFQGFLEIGCGAALPSLTIRSLGRSHVRAFDVNLEMVAKARGMARAAGVSLSVSCRDFDFHQWPGGGSWMWIAVKPRDPIGGDAFMQRIVARGMSQGVGLGLVPRYGPERNAGDYKQRCANLAERLKNRGYAVTVRRLEKDLPLVGILAIPGETGGNRVTETSG